MAIVLFANNASSTLAGAISPTATTANLAPGTGVLFPSPGANQYYVDTFVDAATGLLNEIVWVTSRTVDAITIVRAQEGTTALNWLAGDIVANFWTSGQAAAMLQQGQSQGQQTNYAADTGAANAYVAAFSPPLSAYVVGMPMRVKIGAGNTSTGPSTFNGGPSTIPIVRRDGSAVVANELPAGYVATFTYDGANAQISDTIGRIQLAANADYYITTTGNDSTGNGSSAFPWATLQKAWDYVQQNLDINGFTVTVHVGTGTYSAGLVADGAIVGQTSYSGLVFLGNAGTPANVVVNVASADCFAANSGAKFTINGFKLLTSGVGNWNAIGAGDPGSSIAWENIDFGSVAYCHVGVSGGAEAICIGDYTISGNGVYHCLASYNANVAYIGTITVTIPTVGLTMSNAFIGANGCGTLLIPHASVTFDITGSMSATLRYLCVTAGGVDTQGGTAATYLPGTGGAGTATAPGWYA